MKKKPHAFRSYVTDWVESEEFRKQEEQYPEPSEPMQIGLPGGRKINVNKDLFEATKELLEGKEITVLQRKKNNGKTIRPKKT
jgi:hypothetical protein